MPRRTKLQMAEDRNRTTALDLETATSKRKLARVQGRDDATKVSKDRRQAKVETGGEGKILDQKKRLKAAAIGRDLERNFSPAKSIVHQFKTNVVGPLGKIQVNIKGGESAAAYFNGTWAKNPDFRNDDHLSTIFQNMVASVIREGDFLAVFDDGVIEDSGKLLTWESDQVAPLSAAALKESPYKTATQDNGILRDKWGRELAYICSGKRGQFEIENLADATIFPRGVARLVRNPWRLNQGRGVGSLLTPATQFEDLYEILAAELLSAKRASNIAGYTKRKDGVDDYDDPGATPGHLPENSGKDSETTAAEGANAASNEPKNYERFEALAGGMWEYLAEGDEIETLDINRPNPDLAPFIEAVMGMSGSSMGMAQVYTTLKASTSYTAFRGEMILSWATYFMLQKWLERTMADWLAEKVLTWAMRKKLIKKLPRGWEESISWAWPTMPSVDPLKEANATKLNLKNGVTDYSKLIGPDWDKRLTGFSDQVKRVRELDLPLSILETAAGNIESKEPEKETDEDQ